MKNKLFSFFSYLLLFKIIITNRYIEKNIFLFTKRRCHLFSNKTIWSWINTLLKTRQICHRLNQYSQVFWLRIKLCFLTWLPTITRTKCKGLENRMNLSYWTFDKTDLPLFGTFFFISKMNFDYFISHFFFEDFNCFIRPYRISIILRSWKSLARNRTWYFSKESFLTYMR